MSVEVTTQSGHWSLMELARLTVNQRPDPITTSNARIGAYEIRCWRWVCAGLAGSEVLVKQNGMNSKNRFGRTNA